MFFLVLDFFFSSQPGICICHVFKELGKEERASKTALAHCHFLI